jgi:DNA-binding XRE family transcriptional regulator
MVEHCWEERTIFERGGFEPVSVGKRLRELRTNSGYSIKTLAEKSGLSVNTLSLIENEKTSPSVNT